MKLKKETCLRFHERYQLTENWRDSPRVRTSRGHPEKEGARLVLDIRKASPAPPIWLAGLHPQSIFRTSWLAGQVSKRITYKYKLICHNVLSNGYLKLFRNIYCQSHLYQSGEIPGHRSRRTLTNPDTQLNTYAVGAINTPISLAFYKSMVGTGTRAHVRTPFPYLGNGWTECAETSCVVRRPLAIRGGGFCFSLGLHTP